jgi:hypothetical protein
MSSSSTKIKLTVVQLDLVNSSKSFQDIHNKYNLGAEALAIFIKQIEDIISTAFNQSIENRRIQTHLTKIETPLADGCRLTFESVENAYDFVKIFCEMVDKRNQKPGIDQWCFRIGAATDDIVYDPERPNQMIGNVFMVVKELESGAFPGWLFVDKMTYNELSQDKFSKQSFKNKHDEFREAYGYPMLENYVQPIKPIIWTDDDNKQVLIKILQDVFTEEELKTICENHTSKLKGNPYDAITGNTVNARYSSLVNHLIRKGLIDSFLDILCKSSEHFADLVKSLRG